MVDEHKIIVDGERKFREKNPNFISKRRRVLITKIRKEYQEKLKKANFMQRGFFNLKMRWDIYRAVKVDDSLYLSQ